MPICIICGEEFVKNSQYQKCCLGNCKEERIRRYAKKYREENKKIVQERQKHCIDKNPEKYRSYKKKYEDKNREALNKRSRILNKTKKGKSYKKRYAEKNKEKRNEIAKNRLKNDYKYRLNVLMSSCIKYDLKNHRINKNKRHWETIVSFDKKGLRKHIEKLFQPGMSWDNYGEWQIDHIIPRAFFRYTSTDDVEFQYCWSLDNLQPLWTKDNLKKRNKVPGFKSIKGEYVKI